MTHSIRYKLKADGLLMIRARFAMQNDLTRVQNARDYCNAEDNCQLHMYILICIMKIERQPSIVYYEQVNKQN